MINPHRIRNPHLEVQRLMLIEDDEGDMHFATEIMPIRLAIDVERLPFRWTKLDEQLGRITIALDGRTVTYERVAKDLHGAWICDIVEDVRLAT